MLERQALLEAAARAMAGGFGQMSLRGLARELGVSLAALQHHTATKDDLLDAVLAEVVVPRMAADRQRLEAAGQATSADLHGIVLGRLRSLVVHGALVASILQEEGEGTSERRQRVLAAIDSERRQVLAGFERLADLGVIRRISPAVWTAISVFAVPAVGRALPALPAFDLGVDVDPEAVLSGVADLLVHGLLPGQEKH